MTIAQFAQAVNDLCDFYERKAPDDKKTTLDQWHALVKHIPAEALAWIVKRIKQESEAWPRNLPRAILQHADEWWQANPEKKAKEETVQCPDCEQGMIYVRKRAQASATLAEVPYQYVYRCGRCQQSRVESYPMARLKDLIAQGYELTAVWDATQAPAYEQERKRAAYKPKEVPSDDREAWRMRLRAQAEAVREGAR